VSISPNVFAISMLINAARHLSWREYETQKILTDTAFSILYDLTGSEWQAAVFAMELHNSRILFWDESRTRMGGL
jgi:hypothetical protein